MHTIKAIKDLINIQGKKFQKGEIVTQKQHALQCAYYAKRDGNHDEFVIACMLHDIGVLLGRKHRLKKMGHGIGIANHEGIGAKWLQQRGFSNYIVSMVKNHVNAKRYQCQVNPNYYKKLSPLEKETLTF